MNFDPEIPAPTPADDATSPALPKLPFIIGDVILVGAALGIWATQSPLSTASLLVCLGAVALGALLFVLPYAMEYFNRAQSFGFEVEQSRAQDDQRMASFEAAARQLARAAAEAQDHAARATTAHDNVTRRLETRLAPLADIQKNLITAVTEIQAATTRDASRESKDLQRELDRLRSGQTEKLLEATEKLAAVATQLQALLDRPAPAATPADASLTAALTDLCERVEKLAGSSPGAPAHPIEVAAPTLHAEASDAAPAPSTVRGKLFDSGADVSMLAKALSSAQPAEDSPAVARIIQSRPRKPRKSKLDSPESDSTPSPVEGAEVAASAAAVDSTPSTTEPSASPSEPVSENLAPAFAEEPAAKESWDALASGSFDTVTGSSETPLEVHEPPPAPKRRSKRAAPVAPPVAEPEPASTENKLESPSAPVAEPPAELPAVTTFEQAAEAVAVAEPAASASVVAEPAVAEVIVAESAASEVAVAEPVVAAAVAEPAVAVAVVDAPEAEAPKVARSARSKARALLEDDDEDEAKPAQVELIAPAEEPTRKRRASKPADSASLVARVLIGIGNKPYVRGDGPGLSADKGVPMEFVEIGKWQWVAPASAAGPISIRILKNDEIPATGDAITLHPGQALEVSPVFRG